MGKKITEEDMESEAKYCLKNERDHLGTNVSSSGIRRRCLKHGGRKSRKSGER
jgi:hypothetical protein